MDLNPIRHLWGELECQAISPSPQTQVPKSGEELSISLLIVLE